MKSSARLTSMISRNLSWLVMRGVSAVPSLSVSHARLRMRRTSRRISSFMASMRKGTR